MSCVHFSTFRGGYHSNDEISDAMRNYSQTVQTLGTTITFLYKLLWPRTLHQLLSHLLSHCDSAVQLCPSIVIGLCTRGLQ